MDCHGQRRREKPTFLPSPSTPSAFLTYWVAGVSLIAFVLMLVDKLSAKMGLSRVAEMTFFTFSLLGGFPGVILGGLAFHHKTSKSEFWVKTLVAAIPSAIILVIFFSPSTF
ncbi:MAG: DUF1294 domain-containing protein [Thaumarchaeota archaeon]|nr:DUF1294 domain-containing protein [Nitrososphaerota archaeon]